MNYETKPYGEKLVVHAEPKDVYGFLDTTDLQAVLDDCPFMNWYDDIEYNVGDIDDEYTDGDQSYRYNAKAINAIEKEDPNGTWHIPNRSFPAFYVTETKIWMVAPFISNIN